LKKLYIDIKTFSGVALEKSGVYKYAEDIQFMLLLFAYAIDGGAVNIIDLAQGQTITEEIISALIDTSVEKWAFNAQSVRVCLSQHLKNIVKKKNVFLNPKGWHCLKVLATYAGLPPSLKGLKDAGTILYLNDEQVKEYEELQEFFCSRYQPLQNNCNAPSSCPIKWAALKVYTAQDVKVAMEIHQKLMKFNIPTFIWSEYWLDQQINDTGVLIDKTFVNKVLDIDEKACSENMTLMKSITGLENPNSLQQMKKWLANQGVPVTSLDKSVVSKLIKTSSNQLQVQKVLSLWQALKKTSVRKYSTMNETMCADGRARGMFEFYGAKTGRWTGKLIQLQNLPQNHINDLEQAKKLVASGDLEKIKAIYPNVRDILSQLIRTAFIPDNGKILVIADFSAIEARVLAGLAGETWRQEVFKNNGDIYCASASKMFGVNVVKNGENGHLRAKGKVAELALGYGGSEKALIAMGAIEAGLSENELPELVKSWRASNQNIVKFWNDIEQATIYAIKNQPTQLAQGIIIECHDDNDFMSVTLNSGRRLIYRNPQLHENYLEQAEITYYGFNQATNKYGIHQTYGAKLVENIVQATARDILASAMSSLKDYRIVMHVHDEIVIEADSNVDISDIKSKMELVPVWANGLKLDVECFTSSFYRKG